MKGETKRERRRKRRAAGEPHCRSEERQHQDVHLGVVQHFEVIEEALDPEGEEQDVRALDGKSGPPVTKWCEKP
eukprot:4405600-Pyramimonas_sp.AAC.1